MSKIKLAYIGRSLPCRTETFVFHEVLELKRQGWDVETISVHAPETNLGSVVLDQLAESAIQVYSQGALKLFIRFIREMFLHPFKTLKTVGYAMRLALFHPLTLEKRAKLIVQVVAALSVAQQVREKKVQHLHAHMAHVPTTIALFLAKQLDIPFSFTGHAVDIFRDRILLREKLRAAAFVVCISDWHRLFYQNKASLSDEKLPVIRCGVDMTAFTPRKSEQREVIQILSLGRLVPKKGHLYLLSALKVVQDKGIAFTCEIIGEGPERELLEQQITTLGLNKVVTLLGAKEHSEVKERMRHTDLFVLPCQVDPEGDRDGIPVALMEAMACGIPVVSGDLPTIRELVENDQNGLLIDPANVERFAQVLENLITDSSRREHLGKAGRKMVEQRYDLKKNVEKLGECFER